MSRRKKNQSPLNDELLKDAGLPPTEIEHNPNLIQIYGDYRTDGEYILYPNFDDDGEIIIEYDKDGNPTGEQKRYYTYKRIWGLASVQALYEDIDTETQYLQLDWYNNKTDYVSRAILDDERLITSLVSSGKNSVPGGKKNFQKYLTGFIQDNPAFKNNQENFKKSSSVFGWRFGEFIPFSKKIEFLTVGQKSNDKNKIHDAIIKPAGTLEQWLKIIKPAWKESSILRLAMAVSLASILLIKTTDDKGSHEDDETQRKQDIGFFFSLHGFTHTGKTNIQKLSASLIGNPGVLVGSFQATFNYFNSRAELFNHLPFYMDETQHLITKQKHEKQSIWFDDFVYSFTGATDKGRNDAEGMRATGNWCNICFATGEIPMRDMCKEDGAKSRIIDIHVKERQFTTEVFAGLKPILTNHCYGHILPLFVEAIQDGWKFQEEIEGYKQELIEYEGRQADGGAIILTCLNWLHENVFKDDKESIEVIAPHLVTLSEIDNLTDAVNSIRTEITACTDKFLAKAYLNDSSNKGLSEDKGRVIWGTIDLSAEQQNMGGSHLILAEKLNALIKAAGYNPVQIIRKMINEDYIIPAKKKYKSLNDAKFRTHITSQRNYCWLLSNKLTQVDDD